MSGRQTLRLTALLLATPALVLFACGPAGKEGADRGQGAEIECVGMTFATPLGKYSRVATRFGGRCNWLVSDTLSTDRPTVATASNFGEANTFAMTFVTAGATWTAVSGDIHLSRNERLLGEGTYDVLARNPAGEELRIRGPFDFCAYGNRADCPHQSSGGLNKRLELEAWSGLLKAHSEASWLSDCRVLIDRKTEGVQVDLQIGVFNGINIAHWVDQCEVRSAPLDTFTFRAGGVTGPGSYGPYTSRSLPHPDGEPVVLPQLSFSVPLHYLGWSTACLVDMGRFVSLTTQPGVTECAWTIEEEPGRFTLNCNGVRRYVTRDAVAGSSDLTLEADCDVRYVD